MTKPFFKKSCRFDEKKYLSNVKLCGPYSLMTWEDQINMIDYKITGCYGFYNKARKLMKRKKNRLRVLEEQAIYRNIFGYDGVTLNDSEDE